MSAFTTKWALIQALFNGSPLIAEDLGLNFAIVNAVEREDGSNKRYNVTGIDNRTRKVVTVFVCVVEVDG